MKRALLLLAVLAILPSRPAGAASPDDPPECKDCRHLCFLMDQMLQHEAAASFYWKFATNNPKRQSAANSDAVWNQVSKVDFDQWTKTRDWPCGMPGGGGGKKEIEIDLATTDSTVTPPCTIFFGNDELWKGNTHDRFTKGKCSDVVTAVIKHEEKHQQDCKQAKAMNKSLQGDPPQYAQTEFDANSLHAQILRQEIRKFIDSTPNGCGWVPTEGQKIDPKSIPSVKQMQDMHDRDEKIRLLLQLFPLL